MKRAFTRLLGIFAGLFASTMARKKTNDAKVIDDRPAKNFPFYLYGAKPIETTDGGIPPMWYGMYLQRIGRQKWTISKKSRRYKK